MTYRQGQYMDGFYAWLNACCQPIVNNCDSFTPDMKKSELGQLWTKNREDGFSYYLSADGSSFDSTVYKFIQEGSQDTFWKQCLPKLHEHVREWIPDESHRDHIFSKLFVKRW